MPWKMRHGFCWNMEVFLVTLTDRKVYLYPDGTLCAQPDISEADARAKAVRSDAALVRAGKLPEAPAAACAVSKAVALLGCKVDDITYGSLMTSDAIGDGSSREQAAITQKVLSGCANLACEYSTKRYRSNLINWGILPLLTEENPRLQMGDFVLIENVRQAIAADNAAITLHIWNDSGERTHTAALGGMTKEEKEILASGCLINYYKGC